MHRAAEIFENLYRGGDALPGRLVRRIVGLVEMTDQADAQALDLTREGGPIIRHRAVGASGIGLIVPGHRLQQDCAILGSPRHRAGMIEREGQRQYARPADPAVARLEAGKAAERSGAADRAAGVAAGAAKDKARRNRSTSAAARAAGKTARIPGVAGGR